MFRYSNCYVDAENTTVQAVTKVIKENSESDKERILKSKNLCTIGSPMMR